MIPLRRGALSISRRANPESKSRATANPVNTPPNAADERNQKEQREHDRRNEDRRVDERVVDRAPGDAARDVEEPGHRRASLDRIADSENARETTSSTVAK